jgi:hypothetical protein
VVFVRSKSENPCPGIDRSLEQAASVMPGVLDRAMTVRQAEGSGEMAEEPAFRSLEERLLVRTRTSRNGNALPATNLDQGENAKKRTRLFGFMYDVTVTFFNIVVWGLLALFALLTLIYS